ncbi:amino acid permease [Burkholderia pseudomallei]|nr:amino acid permease [Burkholderia pseudomallei]
MADWSGYSNAAAGSAAVGAGGRPALAAGAVGFPTALASAVGLIMASPVILTATSGFGMGG